MQSASLAKLTSRAFSLALHVYVETRRYALHAGVVLLGCIAVWLLQREYFLIGDQPVKHGLLLVATVLTLSFVRSADVARPLLIAHRTMFVLFAFWWAASWGGVPEVYGRGDPYVRFLYTDARWVAIAAAIIAWVRPAFGVIPAVLMSWKNHALADDLGFIINSTHYYPIAELLLYTAFAMGAVKVTSAMTARASPPRGWQPARDWSLGEAAFLGAFAIHMANYFYSAIAKMALPGAHPLTWVLENQTHGIMLATWTLGHGPLHMTGPLALGAHEFMANLTVPLNAVTVLIQLLGLVCVVRIRWAMAMTVIYDGLHLIIFLTTGILFWKWMVFNFGLLLALRGLHARKARDTHLSRPDPPWPLAVMAMAVLLLSTLVFRIAWLGWFDTGSLNKPYVEAELADGSRVPVPSTYFLATSSQIPRSFVGKPFDGHFPGIGTFGKAEWHRDIMVGGNACELPVEQKSGLSKTFARDPRLARYFKAHHDHMVKLAGEDGRVNFWVYPHHNWPSPLLYRDFSRVDIRDIRAYHYIVESICMTYDGSGGVNERVVLKGSHEIPVQRQP